MADKHSPKIDILPEEEKKLILTEFNNTNILLSCIDEGEKIGFEKEVVNLKEAGIYTGNGDNLDVISTSRNLAVDRRSLPLPQERIYIGAEYIAPNSDTEKKLAEIWKNVLGIERVGIIDKFFDMGGDLLKAVKIASQAAEQGINFSSADMFIYKTIKGIINNINRSRNVTNDTNAGEDWELNIDIPRYELTPVTDNFDIKELKIKLHREITTYLHRSLPLCFILSDEKLLPWYYQHFMQICSQTTGNGYVMLDFLEPSISKWDVIEYVFIGYEMLQEIHNVIDFVIEKIDSGCYIAICLDEYYISQKANFHKKHFVHETAIYGYDNFRKEFMAIGFNNENIFDLFRIGYGAFLKGYESGKLYYKDSAPYAAEKAIQLFSLIKIEDPYPFDINLFLKNLEEYLLSKGSSSRSNYFIPPGGDWMPDEKTLPEEMLNYGLKVYNDIINSLEKLPEGKILIDYRAFHMLAEHKKSIYARFQYVISRYNITGTVVDLVQRYEEIVRHFEALRVKSFYMFFSNSEFNSKLIDESKEIIKVLRKLENDEQILLCHIFKQFGLVAASVSCTEK